MKIDQSAPWYIGYWVTRPHNLELKIKLPLNLRSPASVLGAGYVPNTPWHPIDPFLQYLLWSLAVSFSHLGFIFLGRLDQAKTVVSGYLSRKQTDRQGRFVNFICS